jgi:hypothetical protein
VAEGQDLGVGYTHHSADVTRRGIRVVANQRGYVLPESAGEFNKNDKNKNKNKNKGSSVGDIVHPRAKSIGSENQADKVISL